MFEAPGSSGLACRVEARGKMTSTVCLLAKNEQRAIAEWLAYQFVIGFDRIFVYDNGSTDSTAEIVKAIAEREPAITYVSWPDQPGQRPQPTAYVDALKKCETDWIAFFDTDEFFVPKTADSVNGFLATMPPEVSAVAINWLIFGSAGRIEAGKGLVIDRFTRCAGPHQHKTRICKSFVRPKDVGVMHVHTASLINGIYANALGRKVEIENNAKLPDLYFQGAQLNHYLLKSREEFLIKRARGHSNRTLDEKDKFTHMDDDYWKRNDLNEGEDLQIMKWRDAVCAKMAGWPVPVP
jgi:glycosyltransferase involved in cell wall biosynthesis